MKKMGGSTKTGEDSTKSNVTPVAKELTSLDLSDADDDEIRLTHPELGSTHEQPTMLAPQPPPGEARSGSESFITTDGLTAVVPVMPYLQSSRSVPAVPNCPISLAFNHNQGHWTIPSPAEALRDSLMFPMRSRTRVSSVHHKRKMQIVMTGCNTSPSAPWQSLCSLAWFSSGGHFSPRTPIDSMNKSQWSLKETMKLTCWLARPSIEEFLERFPMMPKR